MTSGPSGVHTFLIADIRGYSRFTERFGDEAAAELSRTFGDAVREIVDAHEGELREMRGDEALAVFASARQAIRAGVELQVQLEDQTNSEIDLPCKRGERPRPSRCRCQPTPSSCGPTDSSANRTTGTSSPPRARAAAITPV